MADSEKIDEMRDMLHELRPVVLGIREDTKSMDERLRGSEIRAAEHGVKIERLQDDVDGLGRKVRAVEVRQPTTLPPSDTGRWASIAELLGAIPGVWHFVGYAVAGIISIAALIARHK